MLFFLNLLLTISLAQSSTTKLSTGKAYNKNNELIYTEKHIEQYSKKREILSLKTTYFNTKNEKFAELKSDFKKHTFVPDHRYEDSRMKRYDGIYSTNMKNKVIAFAKPNESKKLKEKEFSVSKDLVSGQGLYSYVYTNFDQLLNMKNPIYVKFLIPMQQAVYSFKIEQHFKDESSVIYRIKFSNWFIRMFAPFIQVKYNIKSKRLLEFQGPSNVPGQKGEIQTVTIKYENS